MRHMTWCAMGIVACGGSKSVLEESLTEPPVATITSHVSGESVAEGQTIRFSGGVTDVDNEISELTTTWWAGDEIACDEATPEDDGFTLCAIEIPSGSSVDIRLDVVDNRTLGSSDKISVHILPASDPQVTILSPAENTTIEDGNVIAFTATITDDDSTADSLRAWWTVDGEETGESWAVASSGNVEGDLDPLALGEHTMALWAEDEDGNSDYASVSVTVIPAGADPDCEITSPDPSVTGREGADVVLTVSVSDAEQDADTLAVAWASSLDTDWSISAAPNSDGVATVTSNTLSKGTHTLSVTVTDDAGGTCVDNVSFKIGEPPTVSITDPTDGDTFDDESLIILTAAVNDDETFPEALQVIWTADFDGTVLCAEDAPTSAGVARCNVYSSTLAPLEQTISVGVTDGDGLMDEAYVRITINDNAPPALSDVEITPNPATAEDTLSCGWTTDDAEGDTVTVAVSWDIGGALAGTGSTLSGSFAKDDIVTCTATPSDATSAGIPGVATITIANAAPSVSLVSITPEPAYGDSTLNCAYTGYDDPDGDADMSTFAWTVNGAVVPSTTDSLADVFADGDDVACFVTPNDGEKAGTPVSDTVTIGNTAPTIDSVTIAPDPAFSGDTLNCSWSGFDDPDGGTDASTVAWTLDGAIVGTDPTLIGTFVRDDGITCTVTPTDSGGEVGSPMSATIVMSNTAPTLTGLTITPSTPSVFATLGFTALLDDLDGDSVSTSVSWALEDGTALSSATILDLDGLGYPVGTWIHLTVIPSDGLEDGPTSEAWVELQDSAPSILSLTLSPSEVYTNDILSATSTAFDPESDPVTVSYVWTVNGVVVSGETGDTLDGALHFDRDDAVSVVATPSDGTTEGAAVSADPVTVRNSPPSSATISIVPEDPTCAADITCIIDSESTDEDGDTPSYSFVWTVDGDVFEVTEEDSPDGTTVLGVYTVCGEEWMCTITPNDGTDDGPSTTASVATDSLPPSWESYTPLETAEYTFLGETPVDFSGYAVANAGDVDNDGLADILVGAYYNDAGGGSSGQAYLVLGTSIETASSTPLSSADYSFVGEEGGDYAGHAVASAGDIDGDGKSDILIGAFQNNDGGDDAGKAYIVLGGSLTDTTSIDLISANYKLIGEGSGDMAGHSVSSAGDVDGDGRDDVLVGAPFAGSGGRAYLILAASMDEDIEIDLSIADYIFWSEGSGENAGYSVSSAGDVDGDGRSDILIGAPASDTVSGPGSAALFLANSILESESASINMGDADYTFNGEAGSDQAGFSVSSAGDMNGDGMDDILIGANKNDHFETGAGKVYLIFGSSLGTDASIDLGDADYAFVGEAEGDQAGVSVSDAGDVDGDGLGDIVIGASHHASHTGRVYVVLGTSLGLTPIIVLSSADYIFGGEYGSDFAGYCVSGAGDVNGDGRDDILIGAYGNDDAGDRTGKTYLMMP